MRNRMRSRNTGHYFSRYLLTFIRQDSCPPPPVGGDGHEHRFAHHCVRPYRPESA